MVLLLIQPSLSIFPAISLHWKKNKVLFFSSSLSFSSSSFLSAIFDTRQNRYYIPPPPSFHVLTHQIFYFSWGGIHRSFVGSFGVFFFWSSHSIGWRRRKKLTHILPTYKKPLLGFLFDCKWKIKFCWKKERKMDNERDASDRVLLIVKGHSV